MNLAAARRVALTALWVQVAALVAYGVYDAGRSQGLNLGLGLADTGLAALSLGLWTWLLGQWLRGHVVGAQQGVVVAFKLLFSLLFTLRAAVWLLTSLAILGGAGDSVNPVSLLALFLVWGAAIVAGLGVYIISAHLFTSTTEHASRARLLTWLNASAAVSVALSIMNIWPPSGFGAAPVLSDQLIYAVQGALDVSATLLALRAVKLAGKSPERAAG